MAKPEFVRVRVKSTKTHITTAAFDPNDHVLLKQDALDRNGRPRAAKYPKTPSPRAASTDEAEPDEGNTDQGMESEE